MFRHKRVTDLSGVLQDRELILYFGWSPNLGMPSHYSHLNAKDLDNKMLKLSGVKIDEKLINSKLPTVRCYRCGEINNISNSFCFKCLTPLTENEKMKEFVNFITRLYLNDQITLREFDEMMDELKRNKGKGVKI